MPLAAGTMAGPYRVESLIGSGGMGEVYRAQDTRLKRAVALKLLPDEFAADGQRRRRFEQEARSVAALNHPNILAVYDIGELDGRPYLVAELLEGQSLRQRLRAGAMAPRKVAEYGAAIAQGLAAAHAHGVIHRDLKPENLFLTKEDRIKILDFGLAKASAAAAGLAADDAPTVAASTEPGAVLGTIGYMAPEQARGEATDARSDIFSLGAVLYEMVSGQRAFQRRTGIETLNAISNDEPAELATPERVPPPALTRAIQRCLEKEPGRRWQSAQDLAYALENAGGAGSSAQMAAPPAPLPARRRWAWWITPAAVVIAAAATWVLTRAPSAAAPPRIMQLTFRQGLINNARFEPHGAGVIYSADWDGAPPQLFELRASDQRPRAIGAGALADVSPSGQIAILEHCAYTELVDCEGTLALAGSGAARPVADNVIAASFSPTGQLAAVEEAGNRFAIDYPIGHVLWRAPAGIWINSLRFSPDGRWLAFLSHPHSSTDDGGVEVISASGGGPRALAHGFASVEGLAWTGDGRAVEVAASGQVAMANSIRIIPLHGAARVVERLAAPVQVLDLAPDGAMLFARDDLRMELLGHFPGAAGVRNLTWQDWSSLRWISPNGQQVLFCECATGGGAEGSAYLRPTNGGPALRVGDGDPYSISPDGKYVTVSLFNSHAPELLPVGVGPTVELSYPGLTDMSAVFLPSGQGLLITGRRNGIMRAYVQALHGAQLRGRLRPISGPIVMGRRLPLPNLEGVPLVGAEDGKWYVYPLSGSGPPSQIPSLGPNDNPIGWSADWRRVYVESFSGFTTTVVAVDLASGQRTTVFSLTPQDLAGFVRPPVVRITPDGRYYAYDVERIKSSLVETGPRSSTTLP